MLKSSSLVKTLIGPLKYSQRSWLQRKYVSDLSLCRPKKKKYPLQYKVRVVNQDGSSYMTRYHLPVGVIRLPIDPNSLTEDEKKERLKRVRSGQRIQVEEYKEHVKFDRKAMIDIMKRKMNK